MANIEAHITGTVWEILVSEGDQVDEGDEVLILESMKMEVPVESECTGTVSRVLVEKGKAVNLGDALIELD